jgi:hypothetical protein
MKLNQIIFNVLRLCVCLPLAQGLNLTPKFMGQIAQNRCYTLARLISRMFNWNTKPFSFLFLREGNFKKK